MRNGFPLLLTAAVVFLHVSAPALSASTSWGSVHLQGTGLFLPIPADWQEVPTSALDQVVSAVRKRAPNAQVDRPVAAFQKPPLTENELTYPYILVYEFPSHPLSVSDLKTLARQMSRPGLVDEERKNTSGLINATVPSYSFDKNTSRIKGAFLLHNDDVGVVAAYAEFLPSSDGLIGLDGYLRESSVEEAQQFYGPMFAAARLDATHDYTPTYFTWPRAWSIDWSKVVATALVGALLAALFGRKRT